MKKLWEQIKRFYDAYKIFVWVLPLCGGAAYDRFVNMWNVSGRLDYDEARFIETRKGDSIMYADHLIEEKSENMALHARIDSLEKKLEKQTPKPKHKLKLR